MSQIPFWHKEFVQLKYNFALYQIVSQSFMRYRFQRLLISGSGVRVSDGPPYNPLEKNFGETRRASAARSLIRYGFDIDIRAPRPLSQRRPQTPLEKCALGWVTTTSEVAEMACSSCGRKLLYGNGAALDDGKPTRHLRPARRRDGTLGSMVHPAMTSLDHSNNHNHDDDPTGYAK